MKIEGNGPNAQIGAAGNQPLDRVGKDQTPGARVDQAPPEGDRVDVSPDGQLMGQAVKAAQDSPAIRQDKVDAARAKLDAGQVGNDPQRLADRMIDHLLGSNGL
ncbi:MAG TPA: flagellar biosynthesis anti-sigma factor FlgM [Vicinamibacterales bacterium]|jgi:flagellar biosynthesis anti-sigma factor FlgM